MRKLFKKCLCFLCLAVLVSSTFALCFGCKDDSDGDNDNKPAITINDEGYLVYLSKVTDIKIYGYNKADCPDGMTAYQIFVKYYPEYNKSEQVWEKVVADGKLKTVNSYDVVKEGKSVGASVISGSAESTGSYLNAKNAVMAIDKDIIMPMRSDGFWSIEVSGSLIVGKKNNGGQFLNSGYEINSGRIYLGTNYNNNILFLGVNILDGYYNYGWDVPTEILSQKHDYIIEFDGAEFTLSIDGKAARGLQYMNISQSGQTKITDSKAASAELITKIESMVGQKYFVFNSFGANSHKCNNEIQNLKITSSASFGYKELTEHPLKNSVLYFLGSSVTRGHGGDTDNKSFVEQIKAITGCQTQKQAVSGTTLAVRTNSKDSYVERFDKFNFDTLPNALIVQLSTNDFSQGIPTGSVEESRELEDLNNKTIMGAVETIIAKTANLSPDTKVIIYTCPLDRNLSYYGEYGKFVKALDELKAKWGIEVVDLFNLNYVNVANKYLQADGLHPTSEGYRSLFTPQIIDCLLKI